MKWKTGLVTADDGTVLARPGLTIDDYVQSGVASRETVEHTGPGYERVRLGAREIGGRKWYGITYFYHERIIHLELEVGTKELVTLTNCAQGWPSAEEKKTMYVRLLKQEIGRTPPVSFRWGSILFIPNPQGEYIEFTYAGAPQTGSTPGPRSAYWMALVASIAGVCAFVGVTLQWRNHSKVQPAAIEENATQGLPSFLVPNPASGAPGMGGPKAKQWPTSSNESLEFTLADGGRVRLHIQTDKSRYTPNDIAEFVLTVTNVTPERTIELGYSNTQVFDFELSDAQGTRVWWYGGDKIFAEVLTMVRLAPGASEVYREKAPSPLRTGQYVIVGHLPLEHGPSGTLGPSVRQVFSVQ